MFWFWVFSKNFLRTSCHFKKNWKRYHHNCTLVLADITRYSCQILKELELSRQIFETYTNNKFHINPSNRIRVFHADRQTDRQEELMKLIASFRNFTTPPKTAELNKFGRWNDVVYGVHRTAYIVQRTAYIVQCTSYSVQRTSYIVQRTAYSIHRTAYIVQRTAYIVQRTAYSVHHTAYSVQRTVYISSVNYSIFKQYEG